MGINEESICINKTIPINKGLIKALLFIYPPIVYKDEEGELVGTQVQFLYGFARYIGYQVDLKVTSSIDELNKAIKSNSYDIVSYFIQEDNAPTDNSYLLFDEGRLNPVIRFSNHPE
jgi:membrane-bound lytic murein transglycosylase MltF